MPNYGVIQYVHIKELAGLHDLARHQHILNTYMENHGTVS